jgi:serine protease Do
MHDNRAESLIRRTGRLLTMSEHFRSRDRRTLPPMWAAPWPRYLRRLLTSALIAIALMSSALADETRRPATGDLIATLQPSVVNISIVRHTKTAAPAGNIATQDTVAETRVQGSGFFVDPSGVVLTNRHVIADASEIVVTLHDGSRLRAAIMATDATNDIALLKVYAGNAVHPLKFGNSDLLRPGDPVFIIGNPLGLGSTVTAGIVSAVDRNTPDSEAASFIQIDAALNVGNSGGPVFDQEGYVVGISTALATTGDQGGSVGLGLAIPGNDARFIVDRLMAFGRVQLGWIGIHVQPVTPDIAAALRLPTVSGSIITRIDADSPAAHAHLDPGDIMLKVDNNDVPGPRELNRKVASLANGSVTPVVVWRAGAPATLSVTVGVLPSDNTASTRAVSAVPAGRHVGRADLGLTLVPLTDEAGARLGLAAQRAGVLIEDVVANSTAWERGVIPGSVIVMVDRQTATSPEDVLREIAAAESNNRAFILLLVRGTHGLHWIPLPLEPDLQR